MAPALHVYDDVHVSDVPFDPVAQRWDMAPRQLLAEWLAVFGRAVSVLSPEFVLPELPQTVSYVHETIASDGPYGANENFYYLSCYSLILPGLLLYFESGRHEGGEPLCMETTGLASNLSSYIDAMPQTPAKARFFIWCEPDQESEIRRALGLV